MSPRPLTLSSLPAHRNLGSRPSANVLRAIVGQKEGKRERAIRAHRTPHGYNKVIRTHPDTKQNSSIRRLLGNLRVKISPDCVLRVRVQGGSGRRCREASLVEASYDTKVPQTAPRPKGCVHRWWRRVACNATRRIGEGQPAARAQTVKWSVQCRRNGRRTARSPECE